MAKRDDENLIIEIELDDGKLAKGFIKAEDVAAKSGRKAGRKFGDETYKSTGEGLERLSSRLVTLGAAFAATFGLREVINASARQQKAVNDLESSLRSIGQYTPQLSRELQEYAAQLQATTRFGDEATLEQIAFAQAMGANVEQSKEIVAAAQDMATALNIDFNSAVRNITKTLGGYAGELGEVIPELKNLTTEQLQNGDGIALLGRKYAGFANRDLTNFDAKVEQAKNTLGDFGEALGDIVTKSDASIGFIGDMSFALAGLTTTLKDYLKPDESGVNEEIERTRELIADLQGRIDSAKNREESWVDSLLGGPDIELMQERLVGLKNRMAELGDIQRSLAAQKEESGPVAGSDEELERLRLAQGEYDKLIGKYTEMGFSYQFAQEIVGNTEWQEAVAAANERLSLSFADLSDAMRLEANKIKITSAQVAATMIQGIGNGAGQAFAAFGKAMAEGENGLEAFLNSFLKSMGQMAVQLGTMYILQGFAELYATYGAKGGRLIAAGGALAAFGGAMGALNIGGGEGSGTSTASSGYSVDTGGNIDRYDNDESLDPENQERQAGQSISVTVQGNVLDGEESGLRIVEMINKAVQEQGASFA